MSITEGAGQALEPAAAAAVVRREALMDDDEIRRTYRIAEALYASGAYKDVRRAETAFAKMVIGRDLGLSPAQSMSGIYLVEGGVQMHYAMLGQFVRGREGYDYRPGWIKDEGGPDDAVQVVWHDEEDAADLRPIVGAVIEFTVEGKRRGVSRFTLDDARQAGLIKESSRAAWNTAPRNMLMARAMSNGVKWFVPEVLGGLPVYVEGELPKVEDRKALTDGTAADDEAQGLDLGPVVEKIIERATELGHRGLSNRAALELALGDRAPAAVNEWVGRAKAELDRFAAEKAAEGGEAPAETTLPDPEVEVTAEPVEEGGEVPATEPEAVPDAEVAQ